MFLRCSSCIVVLLLAQQVTVADIVIPPGLELGDTYHLVFVTAGTHDALDTSIDTYNGFVQDEAERAGSITEDFGISWYAIASTADENANDNGVAVIERISIWAKKNVFLHTGII